MRTVRRFVGWLLGVGRVAGTGVVVAGLVTVVPYLLVRYVGNPLPSGLPAWDEVVLSAQSREVDDSLVVGLLAVVVWLAWAQLLVSLFVEARAAARGVTTSAVRGLGATQWLARRLVAQFTVATSLLVQSSVGLALPPAPALADVVPAALLHDPGADVVARPLVSSQGVVVQVQTSDTLWDLAEQHLGDGSRWSEIRDANVGRTMPDGTVLDAQFVAISGDWSLLIPATQSSSLAASTAPGDTVIGAWRVQQGDHFWLMAETVLEQGWGRPASEAEIREYWLDIIAQNRGHLISPGNDPNLIYAEQSFEILLPPLPTSSVSEGDGLATTLLRPLTGIPQFEPRHPAPPPTHRDRPAPDTPEGNSGDQAANSGHGSGSGPVVEVVEDATTDQASRLGVPATMAASPADAVDGEGDGGSELGVGGRGVETLVVAGVGLSAVGAAFVLNSLRARRRYQASRRRPGSVPELPDDEHRQFENRVRAIADHEALRWLTATNKFLSHTLDGGESWHLPPIVAMRAGDHGLEVLLDEDAPAPRGFLEGSQPRSWILDPDIEVRQLEGEAADRLPYAPLLLPVGGTGGGDLLVELAQFGVIGLDGPVEATTGWLRALTVAVATSSWSQHVDVVAIGVDPILNRMPHVQVPGDPFDWAQQVTDRAAREGPRPDSRYEMRLRGHRVDETLVLVGAGYEGVAQHLVEVAELANTPFTLIAAAPVRSEGRIQFEGDRATLEPTGVTFWPSVMAAEAIVMTTTLLDQAADSGSVPVDVHYADEVPGVSVDGEPDLWPPEDLPFDFAAPGDEPADRMDVEWRPAPQPEPAVGEIPRSSATPAATEPSSMSTRWLTPPSGIAAPDGADVALPGATGPSDHASAVDGFEEGLVCAEVADQPRVECDATSAVAGTDRADEAPAGAVDQTRAPADLAPPSADEDEAAKDAALDDGRLFDPEVAAGGLGGVTPGSLGESDSVRAAIDQVTARRPIEVVVLTPTPEVEGTAERLTPKNTSVLAYLAFHRTATSSAVREVFWPSSVSRSTSDNAVSLIRRGVGTASDGTPRLNVVAEGRFIVSDEIGCDWTRFQQLVERAEVARRDHAPQDEMALLLAALGLIAGPIASDADQKHWLWLRDDPIVYSRVETAIVDAAHRLGYLGCELQRPDVAMWAADKGLTVVPEQEALFRIQMSAAALAGDDSTIDSVFRQAQRSARPHGDGVQPETELLYRRLVGLGQRRRARQEETG